MCASISQKSLELGFRISSSNVQNGTLLVRISHSTFFATLTSNTMFTGTHFISEFRHVKCCECVQVRRCGFRVRLYSLRFVYFVRGVRALVFEISSLVFEFSFHVFLFFLTHFTHRRITLLTVVSSYSLVSYIFISINNNTESSIPTRVIPQSSGVHYHSLR